MILDTKPGSYDTTANHHQIKLDIQHVSLGLGQKALILPTRWGQSNQRTPQQRFPINTKGREVVLALKKRANGGDLKKLTLDEKLWQ